MVEYVIVLIIGVILCAVSVSIAVTTFRCKEKVSAVMVSYGFEQFKAHITSSPIFTYTYEGKIYKGSAAESLSQKYALKHYKEGETYTVYLMKKNPKYFKLSRKIHALELSLFAIGVSLIVAGATLLFVI